MPQGPRIRDKTIDELSSHMEDLSLAPAKSKKPTPTESAVLPYFGNTEDIALFFEDRGINRSIFRIVREYVVELDSTDPKFIAKKIDGEFQAFVNASYAQGSINAHAKRPYLRKMVLSDDIRDCLNFNGKSITRLELNLTKNCNFGSREFFVPADVARELFQLTPNLKTLSITLEDRAFDELAQCTKLQALRVKKVGAKPEAAGGPLAFMTNILPGDYIKGQSKEPVLSVIQLMPDLRRLDVDCTDLYLEDAVTIGSKKSLKVVTCMGSDPGIDCLATIAENPSIEKLTLAQLQMGKDTLKRLRKADKGS